MFILVNASIDMDGKKFLRSISTEHIIDVVAMTGGGCVAYMTDGSRRFIENNLSDFHETLVKEHDD